MRDKKFLVGAFILALGGFAAKALGALYRIPLMNELGAEGMGVYQLVFPLYSLLLTLSGTAVPVAISRSVSSANAAGRAGESGRILRLSLVLFTAVGIVSAVGLYASASVIARAQGNELAANGYRAIAPAVALVSVICCLRGYFQGMQKMSPTAVSQVLEQAVKLVLGLYLVKRFLPDVGMAVTGAVVAVTASEAVALLYLVLCYLWRRGKLRQIQPASGEIRSRKVIVRELLKVTVPVAIGGLILPFSQMADGFLVIRLLSRYLGNATALYGLMTGAVFSLNSLPIAVSFAVAVSSVPGIAKTLATNPNEVGKKISVSVTLTMLVAVPATLLIAAMAQPIADILYPNIAGSERQALLGLLQAASFSVLFLSFTQTLTACLQGLGKVIPPVLNLFVGVVFKISVSFLLLQIPSINIFGAVISTNLCYLVAGILNLVYIIKCTNYRVNWARSVAVPLYLALSAVAVIFFTTGLLAPHIGLFFGFVTAFLAGAAVYLLQAAVLYRGFGRVRIRRSE